MQYRLPLYASLLLVLPLCVNNSNKCIKGCSHEGGITGRFRYLQLKSSAILFHLTCINLLFFILIYLREGQGGGLTILLFSAIL